MHYNIIIKSGGGEYCLECQDKDITQREMDMYFANLFGASKEFIDSIKKIDRDNTVVKSIEDFTIQTFVRNEDEEKTTIEESPKIEETKPSVEEKDEFTQIVNPSVPLEQEAKSTPEVASATVHEDKKRGLSLSPLTFKPLPQEELVFQNNAQKLQEAKQVEFIKEPQEKNLEEPKTDSNEEQKEVIEEKIEEIKLEDETIPSNNELEITEDKKEEIEVTPKEEPKEIKIEPKEEKIEEPISLENELKIIEEPKEEPTAENEAVSLDNIEIIEDKKEEIEEIIIPKEELKTELKEQQTETIPQVEEKQEAPIVSNDTEETKAEDFEIVGLDDDKIEEQKEKEKKQSLLNKTIELVQNAVKNIDIASDETFDVDIPDTYSKANLDAEITLSDEDFDKEEQEEAMSGEISALQNNSSTEIKNQNDIDNESDDDNELILLDDEDDEDDEEEQIINQEKEPEINSIFSDESPFENPPESQNIIAAKEYPEKKKALNLDFKTFLSNYETNGIIDDFLICAYYIKHIAGQHSFNMKYINSKLFQATGKIADLSIVNGLINGDFIKVFEVDGAKKYSITSTGEEYFMAHYQR